MKYQLLDSGNLQKLEQVGEYRLIRPALNAFWRPELSAKEWDKADAVFTRDSSGGGGTSAVLCRNRGLRSGAVFRSS